jgi:hypothetical protein
MAKSVTSNDPRNHRKSYEAPRLRVYGNMVDWTKSVSSLKSNKDGGSNNSKTA